MAPSRPAAEAPSLDIDPYSMPVLLNPYPFQEALRDRAPVVRLTAHGVYATGRHAEALEILGDPGRFSSSGGVGIQDIRRPGNHRIPNRLNEVDPPAHTALRGVLSRLMSPIKIRGWREGFDAVAGQLIDELRDADGVDGVRDIAETYVLRAFSGAVGIDLPRDNTMAVSNMRFNQVGPDNETLRESVRRAGPHLEWFQGLTQRDAVQPGSIGELLYDCEDRGEITPGTAANMLLTFVGGGTDSTITSLSHTLHLLARNPDQWARLRADSGLARVAVEEAIRLESPFQMIYRTTLGETELSGTRLPRDAKIGVFLGAANRDPRKFDAPDRYDLSRETAGIHVGFGHGIHMCLGQMLARHEADVILTALSRAFERMELAGTPVYRPVNQMRQLSSLPLRLH